MSLNDLVGFSLLSLEKPVGLKVKNSPNLEAPRNHERRLLEGCSIDSGTDGNLMEKDEEDREWPLL